MCFGFTSTEWANASFEFEAIGKDEKMAPVPSRRGIPRKAEQTNRHMVAQLLKSLEVKFNCFLFSYSFWIGSALKIIHAFELSNFKENKDYIFSCQDAVVGGFSKWPGTTSDPFHTYFGICGLSFLHEPGLLEIMPSLNISVRAYERLLNLQKMWNIQTKIMDIQLNIE